MLAGAKPAIAPLRVLLVGNQEEDFFLIREMLERNRSLIAADLEHARNLEEASEMMRHRPYSWYSSNTMPGLLRPSAW